MSKRGPEVRIGVVALAVASLGAGCSGGGSPGSGGDTTPPAIVSWAPSGSAASSVGAVSVTFSEPMNATSTAVTLMPPHGLGTATWSNGNRTVTYSPPAPLPYSTDFIAAVTGSDAAGNALAGTGLFGFTTRAPPVVSMTPADGDVEVGRDAAVVLAFDEPADPASVVVTATDGTSPVALGAGVWSGGNTVLAFDPAVLFSFSKAYTVSLDGGHTAAGEAYVPAAWTFTISPRPRVLSSYPAYDATSIPTSAPISITFNTRMDPATVASAYQGPRACAIVVWNSPEDTVFTCAPASPLAPSSPYSFKVTTAAKSVGGDAISPEYVGSFTTTAADVDPPALVTVAPRDGTVALPGGTIVFTFDEAMHHQNTEGALTVNVTPNGGTRQLRTGSSAWDGTSRILTFTPSSPFAKGDAVIWKLAATATDVSGNPLPQVTGWFHVVKEAIQPLPLVASISGWLRRDPNLQYAASTGSGGLAGDDSTNSVYRGYWTFDLAALSPAPVRIEQAMLEYRTSSAFGSSGNLGTLYARSVDYGASLGSADFDVATDTYLGLCRLTGSPPRLVCPTYERRYAMSPVVGAHTVDVTDKVVGQDFGVAARGGRSQFQLAFVTGTDLDGTSDYVTFVSTLNVTFDYAW